MATDVSQANTALQAQSCADGYFSPPAPPGACFSTVDELPDVVQQAEAEAEGYRHAGTRKVDARLGMAAQKPPCHHDRPFAAIRFGQVHPGPSCLGLQAPRAKMLPEASLLRLSVFAHRRRLHIHPRLLSSNPSTSHSLPTVSAKARTRSHNFPHPSNTNKATRHAAVTPPPAPRIGPSIVCSQTPFSLLDTTLLPPEQGSANYLGAPLPPYPCCRER